MDISQSESNVCIGDTIYLRCFDKNAYVNLDDQTNGINWSERSESSSFTIYPAVGQPCSPHGLRNGDIICLFACNGYFLSDECDRLSASRPYYVSGPSAEFIVHVPKGGRVSNGSNISLRNRASLRKLVGNDQHSADLEESNVNNLSDLPYISGSRCLVVQKAVDNHAMQMAPLRKQRSFCGSPSRKRRFSLLAPGSPRKSRMLSSSRPLLQVCSHMYKKSRQKFAMRAALNMAVTVA